MDHGLQSTGENKSLGHQVYPTRAGSRKGLISRFCAFAVCSVGPSTSATIGNTQRFSGGIFQCRAIVPNSSARRASGGVLPSSAVSPHRSRHLLAPIDWGQSIYQQALQCRAIVPNSSSRRASGGVLPSSAVSPHRSRHLLAPIDWGQSIYQYSPPV
jgi:hypothetical protein